MAMSSKFVVEQCTSKLCGMRFPCPVDYERRGSCTRCGAATETIEAYPPAVSPRIDVSQLGQRVEIVALADSIRSALNLGAMLRSADGASVKRMWLCGLSAPGDHPKVAKSALGAEKSVSWQNSANCLNALHYERTQAEKDGVCLHTWAIEATETSKELGTIAVPKGRLLLVAGNETAGVDPALLRACEHHVHVPMTGIKNSLNVAVAFGSVLSWVRSQQAT